jgi:hypothetical protein
MMVCSILSAARPSARIVFRVEVQDRPPTRIAFRTVVYGSIRSPPHARVRVTSAAGLAQRERGRAWVDGMAVEMVADDCTAKKAMP